MEQTNRPSESRSYAEALQQLSVRYEQLVRSISILHEIDEIDDPGLEVSEICTRLVDALAAGLAAENCSLTMLDERGEFLELRAASSPFENVSKYFGSGEWHGKKFRTDEGIIGKTVQTGQPIRIEDVTQHQAFVQVKGSPVELRSLMCFPIRLAGKTVGAMSLSHSSPGFFTLESEKTMELVADRAGRLLTGHMLRERLRDAEQHYRLLMRDAADAILVFGIKGDVVSANPAVEAITGVAVDDLIAGTTTWDSGVHEEDLPKFNEYRERILTSEETVAVDYRYRDASDAIHYLEERGSTMRDAKGNCTGIISVIRDETERKLADREHRRLATAIEQAAESIVITNTDGLIEYVNPAFERITGYTRDEAIGQNSRILKSGRQERSVYESLWETIMRGDVWTGRLVNKKKDGTHYTEDLVISPVRDEVGTITHFVAVKRDVTQEVNLENQLQQAHKMEAVGQLAGGVAHDFNNLLQAISGYAQLAMSYIDTGSESQRFLKEVLDASERAGGLTRQLLAFSRREALQPKDINLNTVITDMTTMLRRIIGEHIDLQLESASDLKTVCADAGQIGQVIINLCVNARDAMPGGGKIVIETRNMRVDSAFTRLHRWAREGEQYVLVSVSDTGQGMPQHIQARIFDPFYTTKDVGKGSGMGLAIVYGIIKQHDGMITVYSEEEKGTVFRVYLPAVDRLPAEDDKARDADAPRGRGETVLVAEDDNSVRNLATHILTMAGYQVLIARNGEEAISVFDNHSDGIDLAVLDVVMPKRSGRDVYDHIRARFPDLPIVFSSGYSLSVLDNKFIEKSNAHTIEKPYSQKALLEIVRSALGKG